MAVSPNTTVDVSQALAAILDAVPDVRVEWYIADKSRPPVIVVGQPYIDYADNTSGFCRARWEYPLTVITARNQDRDAQRELSRIVAALAQTLDDADPSAHGLWGIELMDARPTTSAINGQELPAYLVRVNVRA